ncbi:MAG: trypsin-like peptidase domain-containing protein [Hyphomicrobiaceae bacterium]
MSPHLSGILLLFLVAVSTGRPAIARAPCTAEQAICNARASVFRIKSFDPYGSAVRIGPDLLVTNRHVVAGEKTAKVFTETGVVDGAVLPTSFNGDLVLIRAALPQGPVIALAGKSLVQEMRLRTVGYDLGQKDVRVYSEGRVLALPAAGKPLARLHHTAHTQPGNSGGALVDEAGQLVGIATSGGAGVFEAVPASWIKRLQSASDADAADKSRAIGAAYRSCILTTEAAMRIRGRLQDKLADRLQRDCLASGNRQLIDLAAQAFGRSRDFPRSKSLFDRSLELDPNAINARLGLAVTLMFGGEQKAALPHLRELLTVVPGNTVVHRMAIQAGKQSDDKALIATTLDAIKSHNPQGLEAVQRFLDQPARPGRRLDQIRPRTGGQAN